MKLIRLLSIITTLFISFNTFSQQNDSSKKTEFEYPKLKHELKINAISIIVLSALDITYEHIVNEETSFGVSLFINGGNGDNIDDEYRTFSITPYYRNYFTSKYNQGFFIEVFSMYNQFNDYDYDYDFDGDNNDNDSPRKVDAFALGFAAGGKWVTKKGFVAEISLGFGRNLFLKNNDEFSLVGRGGISIGKRF